MKRFPPTRVGAVPTLFQMLLNTPEFYEIDFSRLQFVGTGDAAAECPD